MIHRLVAGALCAFALPLTAQEERTALSFIPEDALFVAWMDGPVALREGFAQTRLAQLLGGPEIQGMVTPLVDDLPGLAGLLHTDVDLGELEEAAASYRGRLLVALGIDFDRFVDSFPDPNFDQVEPWLVIVATPDGETDFERMHEIFIDMADRAPPDASGHVTFGDRELRTEPAGRLRGTTPFVAADHLVAVVGADLEDVLDRSLGAPRRSLETAQVDLPDGALGMWLRFTWILRAVRAASEASDNAEMGTALELIFDTMGLGSLESMSMAVRPAGEHAVMDMTLRLDGESGGLLGALLHANAGAPTSLDLIPVQREVWSITPFDFGILYAALHEMADGISDMTGMGSDELENQFAELFRVRLDEDLIAHLGNEVLSVGAGNVDAEVDGEEPMNALAGLCYGVTLADPTAFGTSLETMIRSRGLHAARKTEDYRGIQVRRIPFLGTLIYYAISDRLLLLAVGEPGAAELRAVLDEEIARRDGVARPALPEGVEQRLDHAIPGWQGISVTSVAMMTRGIVTALQQQVQAGTLQLNGAQMQQFEQVLAGIVELVDRYDLAQIVSVTRNARDAARFQMIW